MADSSNALPGAGGQQTPSQKPTQPGGNAGSKGMSSSGDVQTMADMIELARQKKAAQQGSQAPQNRPAPMNPVQPKMVPSAPKTGPMPTFAPLKPVPSARPAANIQDHTLVSQVAPLNETSKEANTMPSSMLPQGMPEKHARMIPMVLIVMGAVELALLASVIFLFFRPVASVGNGDNAKIKVVEDRLYALETKGQEISTQGTRIGTLEDQTKTFASKEAVTTLGKATDHTSGDTDGDGLNDYREIVVVGTDPETADTDGDGYADGSEVKFNYNPLGDGRIAGLEAGHAYMAQTWTGVMKTKKLNADAQMTLDLTKDETLSGTWSFEADHIQYEAKLTGTYRLSVATDDFEAVADVVITDPTGKQLHDVIGLRGDVDRTAGTIKANVTFRDGFTIFALAGEQAKVVLTGQPEAAQEAETKTVPTATTTDATEPVNP